MAKTENGYGRETARAECPFFMFMTDRTIICESALSQKGSSSHWFKSKKEKEKYLDSHCCKDRGEGCLYYNAIMLKYEQEC